MSKSATLICIATFILSCSIQTKVQEVKPSVEYSSRVESLVDKMTIKEKVGQMNQFNGFWDATGPTPKNGSAANKYAKLRSGQVGSMLNVKGVEEVKAIQKIVVEESRLGIPLLFGFDIVHGYKTLSPIPLAEAASWDLEAIEKSAQTAATEAAAAGINWTFAPMMDISRDARWGRVMEGAGEDPYLGSKIAVARVNGFQGNDLSSVNTVAACAKHFAGYGFVEGGLEYNTVSMGLSDLHNVVLPPFKAAVNAGVATVMNSFNELNGVPATGDKYLQRDILKGEWGFNGFVISDWGSIGELVSHGYAEDYKDAAFKAVIAGSDMDMETSAYTNHLKDLVESGQVPESLVDDAVKRILKVKEDLGLFDDPYLYCNSERETIEIYAQKHRDAVRDVAVKSIVLLKNENKLLPLKKQGEKIAIIGPLADDKNSPLGSWRLASDDNTAVSVLEGLKKYKRNEWGFAQGVQLVTAPTTFQMGVEINETDRSGMDAAIALAAESDKVILVIGEHGFQSGEGRSRTQIDIPGLQEELMQKVYEVNQNIILVLMNGRPLTIDWATKNIPCIVEAWQLGTESGNAIAKVLMGDYNPSGKLPMSFPRNVGQIPIYYNSKNTGRPIPQASIPDMVFWSHYNDSPKTPLYPFGYGLSYTIFEYSNLSIAPNNSGAKVSVTLSNTGDYDGEEVVQLYIRDKVASITRPIKELKGFKKLALNKGHSIIVEFELGPEELGFYDNNGKYLIEPGDFDVMVGGNSEDLLIGHFHLN